MLSQNIYLQGKTVHLRSVSLMDAVDMLQALEPETTKNLQFFSDPPTIGRQRAYLHRMLDSPTDLLFAIVDNTSNQMVGTIGLHEVDLHLRMARIGMLIFRKADRGHGYGNEATQLLLEHAFRDLKLNKVIINLFETNFRSQEHYIKLGFKVEGLLRQEYLLEGTYHNLVRLSLLQREWRIV